LVEVRLYGSLRRFAPEPAVIGESIVRVPFVPGETVEGVLIRLGVDPSLEVSNVFINGRYHYHALGMPVSDCDRLGVFPKNMGMLYV
jgi:hypothetical protein